MGERSKCLLLGRAAVGVFSSLRWMIGRDFRDRRDFLDLGLSCGLFDLYTFVGGCTSMYKYDRQIAEC